MVFCFFVCSWGADHSAKNWGANWRDGGSLPCNVHPVSPVPFRQVQDPLWPEREWCPVHPMKRWSERRGWGFHVEALNFSRIIRPLCSLPLNLPVVLGLDRLWTAHSTHEHVCHRNLCSLHSLSHAHTHKHNFVSGNGRFKEQSSVAVAVSTTLVGQSYTECAFFFYFHLLSDGLGLWAFSRYRGGGGGIKREFIEFIRGAYKLFHSCIHIIPPTLFKTL